MSAPVFLRQAAETIEERAKERDLSAERSMHRAVAAFNALTKHNLTENDGWVFMAVLKLARSRAGATNPDDYIDGAAYLALALESLTSRPLETTPGALKGGAPLRSHLDQEVQQMLAS